MIERYQYLISPENSASTSSSINHTFNSISSYSNNSRGGPDPVSSAATSLGPPLGQPLHQIADITHWDEDDIETLRDLLELGERAKWKYISTELTRERNKRIPAVACQKKFKDMFGVAEASSALGSSLCYVVSPNGWACLDDGSSGSSNSRAVPPSSSSVMYDYGGFSQQHHQPAPSSMLPYQTQSQSSYVPLTTPSGLVISSTSSLPPPAPISATTNSTIIATSASKTTSLSALKKKEDSHINTKQN